MNTKQALHDRLCVDAKYARVLANAQGESNLLELLHDEGYNLSSDDFMGDIKLTEGELETVQGGFVFVAIMLGILSSVIVGGGVGMGLGIRGIIKKK